MSLVCLVILHLVIWVTSCWISDLCFRLWIYGICETIASRQQYRHMKPLNQFVLFPRTMIFYLASPHIFQMEIWWTLLHHPCFSLLLVNGVLCEHGAQLGMLCSTYLTPQTISTMSLFVYLLLRTLLYCLSVWLDVFKCFNPSQLSSVERIFFPDSALSLFSLEIISFSVFFKKIVPLFLRGEPWSWFFHIRNYKGMTTFHGTMSNN